MNFKPGDFVKVLESCQGHHNRDDEVSYLDDDSVGIVRHIDHNKKSANIAVTFMDLIELYPKYIYKDYLYYEDHELVKACVAPPVLSIGDLVSVKEDRIGKRSRTDEIGVITPLSVGIVTMVQPGARRETACVRFPEYFSTTFGYFYNARELIVIKKVENNG